MQSQEQEHPPQSQGEPPPLEEPELVEEPTAGPSNLRNPRPTTAENDSGSQRVFKKTSPNSLITLYLNSRDVVTNRGVVEPICGVVYIDPKLIGSHKVFGQLTLTFRYGREDEEVMGLKFCNEAAIAFRQIYPAKPLAYDTLTSMQRILVDRLGRGAYAFRMPVATFTPPSVQLIPAKKYTGAPIGTSYDIRIYTCKDEDCPSTPDKIDDKLLRRSGIRLSVRVIHKIFADMRFDDMFKTFYSPPKPSPPLTNPSALPRSLRLRLSPKALKLSNKFCNSASKKDENDDDEADGTNQGGGNRNECEDAPKQMATKVGVDRPIADTLTVTEPVKGPEFSVDKPFLWTEGCVSLKAALDKPAYRHGESLLVTIDVRNNSKKSIRKIRIFAVQHVDVCMFSNGKFKNVVADITETQQIASGSSFHKVYNILPVRGPTKNWIAVEGYISGYGGAETEASYKIASSAPRGPTAVIDRNVFAIFVTYYIKVKLTMSGMGSEVSLKLPFVLGHLDTSTPQVVMAEEANNNGQNVGSNVTGVSGVVAEECGGINASSDAALMCGAVDVDIGELLLPQALRKDEFRAKDIIAISEDHCGKEEVELKGEQHHCGGGGGFDSDNDDNVENVMLVQSNHTKIITAQVHQGSNKGAG